MQSGAGHNCIFIVHRQGGGKSPQTKQAALAGRCALLLPWQGPVLLQLLPGTDPGFAVGASSAPFAQRSPELPTLPRGCQVHPLPTGEPGRARWHFGVTVRKGRGGCRLSPSLLACANPPPEHSVDVSVQPEQAADTNQPLAIHTEEAPLIAQNVISDYAISELLQLSLMSTIHQR